MAPLRVAAPLLWLFVAAGCAPYTRGEALRPPGEPAAPEPTVAWTIDVGRGLEVPPVVRGETLLVGSTDRRLQSHRPADGKRDWRKRLNGPLAGRPAVVGKWAFVSLQHPDGAVYAFDLEKRKVLWRTPMGDPVGDPAFFEGAVLAVASDGAVYALSPTTGKPIWATNIGSLVWGPAVFDSTRALLYVPGRSGKLFGIDARSGEKRWVAELAVPLVTLAADSGMAVAVAVDSMLYAVDGRGGNVLWSRRLPARVSAPPVIGVDRIFIAGLDGRVMAFDRTTGAPGWDRSLGGPFTAAPAIDAGALILGAATGQVWRLDRVTGRILGEFRHVEPVNVTPVPMGELWIVAGERGTMVACRWGAP